MNFLRTRFPIAVGLICVTVTYMRTAKTGTCTRSPRAGALSARIFLNQAIGTAYVPLSLGSDGRICTENDGVLFAVGR